MRIQAGTRLGRYQIGACLGSGGMGEVYEAEDTRLRRRVALKLLQPDVAADTERRARLEREATAVAALNHPHIVTLHSLEEEDGLLFLTMEVVDGQRLDEVIPPGGLPVETLLTFAVQLTDAVSAAHARGIVHRDLKPGNVMVTRDGRLKVLDFGLARLAQRGGDASQVSTRTLTGEGRIEGTIAYMSPEQAEGQTVDARSDVFSLGVMLFEMATRERPFKGTSPLSTLSSIIKDTPPLVTALKPTVPAELARLINRCLVKDPSRRIQTAADVRNELEELRATLTARPARVAGPPMRRLAPAATLTALAIAVLAAGVGLSYFLTKPSAPVTSPSEYAPITNFTESAMAPSLSPDGRMVTFKLGEDFFLSRGQIYVKLLPNGESVRLTNAPEPKYGPVFTPDGSRIAYSQVSATSRGLSWDTWTVPVLGGQPARLLPNASGLTWIADHQVLFAEIKTGLHMGIVTATEGRSGAREIYFPANELAMVHYPYASPNRQWLLVVEMDQTHAFTRPCRLVPFDGSSPGRHVGPQGTCTSAAWSPDGEWMYFGATVGGSSHLWRQKFPDGRPEQITFGPTEQEGVAVAPDGRSLVTSLGTRRSAIWMHDAAGERAITAEGYASRPRLSRDGTRVFYLLRQDSSATSAELRVVDLGSGSPEEVLPEVSVADYDISPDETRVAYTTTDGGGGWQIWVAPLDRRTPPRLVARAGDQVSFGAPKKICFPFFCPAAWSPDGRFFYVGVRLDPATSSPTKTFAIPVPVGQSLPDLPPSGVDLSAQAVALPGTQLVEHGSISPGPDPSTYVFTKSDLQRNLFLIPLH